MVPRPVALTSSESHSDVESSHIDGYRNENTQKTKIPTILSSREHIVPLNVTICLMMMCKGHETRVPSANIRDLRVQFNCDQMQTGYFRWFDGMSNAQNFPADVERSHYHRRNRFHRLQVCMCVSYGENLFVKTSTYQASAQMVGEGDSETADPIDHQTRFQSCTVM